MIDRRRMTDRITPQLIWLELRRAIRPLLMLAVGLAAIAAAGEYILTHINGGIGSTHTMRFEIADATGVVPGRAEVRFYGIEAGQVTDAQLVRGHAVLTVTVADKFGPVYRNATAEVRPNTALQDMYLDIVNRGTPSAGVAGPGYVLPLSQTTSPVNLADVLNTFQPDVRTQIYNLVDQLGNGLANRGADLRRAFALLAPFLQIAGNVSRQLAVRATLTRDLVHNAGVLSQILSSRSNQLRNFVTTGTATLQALATDGGAPLRQTIAELPAALQTVAGTWQAMRSALPNLRDAVASLRPVAEDLPSGLRSLKTFATNADPAVRRLQAPVRRLVPLALALKPAARELDTSLTNISPQVRDVDTVAADAAKCGAFINEFWNWDASMSKWVDSYSPFIRGNVNVGLYSFPSEKPANYVTDYTCAGGQPLGDQPTPKYDGPPPTP